MRLPWLAYIVCHSFLTIFWFLFPLMACPIQDWALLNGGLCIFFSPPFFLLLSPAIPFYHCCYEVVLPQSSWAFLGLSFILSPNGPARPLVLLLYNWRAPISHLFYLGRPEPVCFPWASSALFLTLHYHGLLLNSLGFPSPITLFLILGVHGLAINPLLSLFSLLWVCHGPFSLFHTYTAHGLLFLSFWAPLSPFTSSRPICLSHGLVTNYSCRSGLMDFLSVCQLFSVRVAGLLPST